MPRGRPAPASALRCAAHAVMLLGLAVSMGACSQAPDARPVDSPRADSPEVAAPRVAAPRGDSLPVDSLLLDSLRSRVERAVVSDAGPELDLAIARLRLEAREMPGNRVLQYDVGYALYRRAQSLTRSSRDEEARKLLEEADRALARALSLGVGGGALALRGAVSSDLAAVSGMLAAMRLEPLAFRQLDEALTLAPEDPRVALLNGIARLDAPRALGGGAERGEEELRRAIRLFESDSTRWPAPTWGRADAHIWLGIALTRRGLAAEARASLQRALEFAPGHSWVISTLLPLAAEPAEERDSARGH